MNTCRHPPMRRCRLCQLAGLVPFPPDMPPPPGWAPPPGSPAARGEFPAAVAAAATARCIYLGAEVVGYRDCPTCAGRVRRKEFACALALGTGPGGAACPPVDCPPGRACSGYKPAIT